MGLKVTFLASSAISLAEALFLLAIILELQPYRLWPQPSGKTHHRS